MRIPALLSLAIVVALLASKPAGAADTRRAQVAAATSDALHALEAEVLRVSVTPELTVAQFVDRTGSRPAIAKAVRRAEQIGGTRWLDDQTCQVRMELPGSEVADALVEVAETSGRDAALPPEVLRRRLDPLRERTFAATGMSTGAVDRLRPPADDPAWRDVPDRAVRAAVSDARRNAARQVFESVEATPIPGAADNASLGVVLADPKVRDALQGWVMNRPVTSVLFQPDLEVRVAVAVDGEAFWDELSTAVGERTDLPFPRDDEPRDALRRAVLRQVEPTVGRAQVLPDGATTAPTTTTTTAATLRVVQPAEQTVDIPAEPPRWVGEQVDVRGSSPAAGGALKTARAAENAARDLLRQRIEELPLTRKLSLGQAGERDPRIRGAIDRAVRRGRTRKVNYLPDGGVEVTVTLSLRDLWYDLPTR